MLVGVVIVITGGVVSRTVTVEVQELEFPDASVALQDTFVAPSGNVEPEAGVQLPVIAPGQLSENVGVNDAVAQSAQCTPQPEEPDR